MDLSEKQSAKKLVKRWGLHVQDAFYRETGNWFHVLKKFPGALLDADGYVVFESAQAFRACPYLQIGKEVGAPNGIKVIPGYVFAASGGSDRSFVESLVRPRSHAKGQAWGGSAENRKAIESYAMELARRHYEGVANAAGCAGGTIHILEPWDIESDQLEPIAYECRLGTGRGHATPQPSEGSKS